MEDCTSEIELKAGDTIIVAPATGRFGSGAVTVALAMGASVVACGRSSAVLDSMTEAFGHTGRLSTVALTGDVEKDTKSLITASGNGGQGADAYIDFSPPTAAKSTHFSACLGALRPRGRAAFMGGVMGNVGINYALFMINSLRIQGRFMYDRWMVEQCIKLVEKGNLKLGEKGAGIKTVGKFGLGDVEEALRLAEKTSG